MTSGDGQYSDFIYVVVKTIVGNKEIRKADFKVYPNPATDKLFIKGTSEIHSLKIFFINGMLVKEFNQLNKNYIDVSDLQASLYVYKIESNTGVSSGKFVKK